MALRNILGSKPLYRCKQVRLACRNPTSRPAGSKRGRWHSFWGKQGIGSIAGWAASGERKEERV